jgi:protein gp37
MSTKIEWVKNDDESQGETWNPVTGCTPISEGCKNCYAKRMSKRLAGRFGYPKNEPFKVTIHPDKLKQPSQWKKPKRIFVCSMGDLFHDDVPFEYIEHVFRIMLDSPKHIFQVLTKRPRRAKLFLNPQIRSDVFKHWPFPNVYYGVSVEDQPAADERISLLLQTPASKRFISIEPMLGPISLNLATVCDRNCNEYQEAWCPGTTGKCICQVDLDLVICGAETGPGKRPMDLDWARSIRDQCQEANVPFFFKKDSKGNRELDGKLWEEMI